jgi:hypothetical protein
MWNKYSISISEWWVFFPNKCHWNMCMIRALHYESSKDDLKCRRWQ